MLTPLAYIPDAWNMCMTHRFRCAASSARDMPAASAEHWDTCLGARACGCVCGRCESCVQIPLVLQPDRAYREPEVRAYLRVWAPHSARIHATAVHARVARDVGSPLESIPPHPSCIRARFQSRSKLVQLRSKPQQILVEPLHAASEDRRY